MIIPTRDRWPLLARSALPAALNQEDVELEVIVVDDGSRDETPSRLANVEDSRLRVLRQERSRGVSAARNTGIQAARGEWLAFLDDDDIWAPRKLRDQVDAARAREAGFVYSAAVVLDEKRRVIDFQESPDDAELPRLLLRKNVMPGGCSNVIARSDVVRGVGGFDERLSVFADWDLWIRLTLSTRGAACAEIHVGYLQHRGNMVIRSRQGFFEEIDYLAAKHRSASPQGSAIDRLSAARWAAWANRWAGRRLRAAGFLLRAGVAHRSRRDIVRATLVLARGLIPHPSIARALFRGRDLVLRIVDPSHPQEPERVLPQPTWLGSYDPVPGRQVGVKP